MTPDKARLLRTTLRQLYLAGDIDAVSSPMAAVCTYLVRAGMVERVGGSYVLTAEGNRYVARGDADEQEQDSEQAAA